jgi:hypothetical protein
MLLTSFSNPSVDVQHYSSPSSFELSSLRKYSQAFQIPSLKKASGVTKAESRLNDFGDGDRTPASATSPKSRRRRGLPNRLTNYNLSVTGVTYAGSTTFLYQNPSFTPLETFTLPGILSVEPGIRTNASFRNGRNAKDIGLFIGNNPPLLAPVGDFSAGAAWFATNSQIFRRVGGNFGQSASLDIAFVRTNERRSTIRVEVDSDPISSNPARIVQLNTFNTRTSLFTAPKQILRGTMELRFTRGGRQVSGSATFFGGSFIEPGTYAYQVTFSGTRG